MLLWTVTELFVSGPAAFGRGSDEVVAPPEEPRVAGTEIPTRARPLETVVWKVFGRSPWYAATAVPVRAVAVTRTPAIFAANKLL